MNAYEIIKKPVLSEKSYAGIPNKKYVFIVAAKADKTEIKKAIQSGNEVFGAVIVETKSINIK